LGSCLIAFLLIGHFQIIQFPPLIALSAHSMALLGFVNLGMRNDGNEKQKHVIVLPLLSTLGAAEVLFHGSYLIFLGTWTFLLICAYCLELFQSL
jgi:hypothetical protein